MFDRAPAIASSVRSIASKTTESDLGVKIHLVAEKFGRGSEVGLGAIKHKTTGTRLCWRVEHQPCNVAFENASNGLCPRLIAAC